MVQPIGAHELEGRVAIVTGSTRNIGRAIALDLAEGGAKIVINGRASRDEAEAVAAEIGARGSAALVHLADVTDPRAVEGLVEAAVRTFGRLDILVNNAATRREAPLEEIDLAEWRAVLASILESAFLCSKAAAPHLAKGGAGAIVNIGGLSAHTGAARRIHVVTAKAGLIGMTRALAQELAPKGITVNAVAPGLIATERRGAEPAHHAVNRTLLGRRGEPEEVAAVVRMLCGPRGRYIAGQTIHVNGGAFLP